MLAVQLAEVSTSHPQGKVKQGTKKYTKLSTKNLQCFSTATATEKDVTSLIGFSEVKATLQLEARNPVLSIVFFMGESLSENLL